MIEYHKKIVVIDTRRIIYNRVEVLLGKIESTLVFFAEDLAEALRLIEETNTDLLIYKCNEEHPDQDELLKKVVTKTDTPILYILDKGKEHLFEQIDFPNIYTILVRPFSSLTFRSTIEVYFKKLLQKKRQESIQVKNGKAKLNLKLNEIDWIEAEGNYCYLHVKDNQYTLRMTMKNMLELLPEDEFIRVHRSYIIQLAKVENVNMKAKNLLINHTLIPIGKTGKSILLKRLNIL